MTVEAQLIICKCTIIEKVTGGKCMKKGIFPNIKSIKIKILFLLLLVSLFPLVTITSIVMYQSSTALKNKTEESQIEMAQINADMISLWLSQKINRLENIVKENSEFSNGNKDEILPVLKILEESDDEVDFYSFVNEQGITHDTKGNTGDISSSDNVKNAKASKETAVSDFIKEMVTGKDIIVIDVPLVNEKGEYKGIIQAILDPQKILDIVNKIKIEETGYGYLLSSDGTYLLHPEKEKIGKNISDDLTATDDKELFFKTVFWEKDGFISYKKNDGSKNTAAFHNVDQTDWKLVTSAPEAEVYSEIEKTKNSAFIVILISVALVLLLAYLVARGVLKPLLEITSIMQRVSKGDLTKRLIVKGKDEIAELRKNINHMIESFSLMITKLSQSTEYVTSSSEELTAIAADSANTSKAVTESVNEVAIRLDTHYHSTQQVSIVMDEIALDTQKIAKSASAVTESVQDVAREINQGDLEVQSAIIQMNTVSETVENCTKIIQSLNEKSQEIRNIVSMISEVTDQTNLLALNATIEAARAGEHGKGFAVVANEVKKLAERTSEATIEITTIIEQIVDATGNATHSMNLGMQEVDEGVDQVQKVGSIFETILSEIMKVNRQILEVSTASEQISSSTEEISASTQDIVDISKNSLDNLNEVSSSISNQHQYIKEVSTSAESLSTMAMDLQEMVNQFTIK